MRKQRLIRLMGMLMLLVVLMGSSALAKDDGQEGSQRLAAALGSGFTYQGRLEQGGELVEGDCPMAFRLYDAASDGAQVGAAITRTVTVSAGLFTEMLDFGSGAFAGDRRWLNVKVDCDADGAYADLGRQELTAAPQALYALSAGSVSWTNLTDLPVGFDDDMDNVDDTVSWSEISGIVGTGASEVASGDHAHDGIYAPATHDHLGETWSGSGDGLHVSGDSGGAILSGANSGSGEGVQGRGNSGFGVYGHSSSNKGVYGYSDNDAGVYGESSNDYGVSAKSDGSYGLYAWGISGDVRLRNGTIYANRNSSSDMALHSNNNVDVHLDDDGSTDAQFRVLDNANTPVFTVTESADISWKHKTGYVSIPAAAFRPKQDGYDFRNLGYQLIPENATSEYYYAPVQLPHGATVTKMTFYWYDSSSSNNGEAILYQNNLAGMGLGMAVVNTSGDGGGGSSYDDTIAHATIDNSQYAYYVRWHLPDSNDVRGRGVVIEYTYTGPH